MWVFKEDLNIFKVKADLTVTQDSKTQSPQSSGKDAQQ